MAGKITALLLAILVANPFCCCWLAANAEPLASDDTHACCPVAIAALAALAAMPGESDPAPADSEPCDCSEDRRGEWAMPEIEKPVVPHWFLLSEIAWEVLSESEDHGEFLHRVSDLPDAVKPPGKLLLQAHCRYLL